LSNRFHKFDIDYFYYFFIILLFSCKPEILKDKMPGLQDFAIPLSSSFKKNKKTIYSLMKN